MDLFKKATMNINQYKNIKPLVIGIGVAGKRHLDAQLNLGFTTGVYTTNSETAKSLRDKNKVIVFDNLEKAIKWSNLVHVCTPDDKHTEFVSAAIKKGKAVLCEKSLTTNLEDALKLQKQAHQYNCPLIVGQNYRLTPTFAEIKKRVLEGQIGKIKKIETNYLHDKNDFQQRYGNKNFLYIGGSHAVDLACWIISKKIIDVKITSTKKLYYQFVIQFSSGLLGEIKLDVNSPRSTSGTDLIVYGEKGKLVSHNKIDQLSFYKKGDGEVQSIQFPNTSTYTIALEVKILDDYLLGRRNSYWPLPNVDEAINTIKILDTVKMSN